MDNFYYFPLLIFDLNKLQVKPNPVASNRKPERQSRTRINSNEIYQNIRRFPDKECLSESGNAFVETSAFLMPENLSATASIHMKSISSNPQVPLMHQNLQLQNTSFSSHSSPNHLLHHQTSGFVPPSPQRLPHNQNEYNASALHESLRHSRVVPSPHPSVCNVRSPKR